MPDVPSINKTNSIPPSKIISQIESKSESQVISPEVRLSQLKATLVEQTYIQYSTIPETIQESYYPHFLLWKPQLQQLKNTNADTNKNKVKIIKPPLYGSGWQLPINLKSYHQILNDYRGYHNTKDIFSLSLASLTLNNPPPLQELLIQHKKSIDQISLNNLPIGLGFAYNLRHPFICIDIDYATESNNELLQLLPSYTEWSPSSEGLHIILQLPQVSDKQLLIDAGFGTKLNKTEYRDLYISSGYVTLTGRLTDIPNRHKITIFPVQKLIDILSQFFQTKVHNIPTSLMQKAQSQNDESTKTKKPLAAVQVQKYLDELPVQQLYSSVFDDLYTHKSVILDPACVEEAYTPWLIIGQAIHHNFNQYPLNLIEGYSLWNNWSKLGNKFNAEDLNSKWRSFGKQDETTTNQVTIGALIKLYRAQQPQFTSVNANGAPQPDLVNLRIFLEFYKFIARRNVINHQTELIVPANRISSWNTPAINTNELDTQLQMIKFNFMELGFGRRNYPANSIEAYIRTQAAHNIYNPIKDYFVACGKKWDGKDRLPDLYASISLVTSQGNKVQHTATIYEFIKRWLIQTTAAACRDETTFTETIQQFSTVLIFQGEQGVGKTRWVQALFPKDLRKYCLGNKDIHTANFGNEATKLILELASTLICNINEIDTQFTLKTYSNFKSFLDTDEDNPVLPYERKPTRMVRRTVFIGSTNKLRFLVDPTGNRRVELIHCASLNAEHKIDLDQLWGQVYQLYTNKEKWWFDNRDPKDLIHIAVRDRLNQLAMIVQDGWYLETLKEVFDFDEPRDLWKRKQWSLKNISETLLQYTQRYNPTSSNRAYKKEKHTLESFLTELSNGNPISSISKAKGSRKFYYMPSKKMHVSTQEPNQLSQEQAGQLHSLLKTLLANGKSEKDILESFITKPEPELNWQDEDFKKLYFE